MHHSRAIEISSFLGYLNTITNSRPPDAYVANRHTLGNPPEKSGRATLHRQLPAPQYHATMLVALDDPNTIASQSLNYDPITRVTGSVGGKITLSQVISPSPHRNDELRHLKFKQYNTLYHYAKSSYAEFQT